MSILDPNAKGPPELPPGMTMQSYTPSISTDPLTGVTIVKAPDIEGLILPPDADKDVVVQEHCSFCAGLGKVNQIDKDGAVECPNCHGTGMPGGIPKEARPVDEVVEAMLTVEMMRLVGRELFLAAQNIEGRDPTEEEFETLGSRSWDPVGNRTSYFWRGQRILVIEPQETDGKFSFIMKTFRGKPAEENQETNTEKE